MVSWVLELTLETLNNNFDFLSSLPIKHSHVVNPTLLMHKPISWLIYGIVVSVPLVFGAVHPIVLGFYVLVILICLGGWLLLNDIKLFENASFWHLFPFFLIGYLFFQTIPLPLDMVDLLSPMRAERVRMVNELAGTEQHYVSLSENGIAGVFRAIFVLALLVYYYCLKKVISTDDRAYYMLLYCMIFVGTIEAFYGLIQFVSPGIGILWLKVTGGRAAYGTIIYKNQYASLLNMIWPLAIGGTVMFFLGRKGIKRQSEGRKKAKDILQKVSSTRPQALLLAALSTMIILGVMFSLSRGGILSMILVGFCLILFLPFSVKSKLLSLLIFLLLTGGYGAMIGLDTIVSRFDTIGVSKGARMDIYISSFPMVVDHWLTGIGLGSYTLLSPVYLKGFPEHFHNSRVHSEYLELLIELGIPAASLLFCWLAVGMWKLLARILSVRPKNEFQMAKVIMGTTAICGIIGFLAHGLIDFGWRLPANVFFVMTLLALCVTSLESIEEEVQSPGAPAVIEIQQDMEA